MTEMFPGQYPAGYQEQKTSETKHPADGESQADGLPAVNPEALQEEKGRLSRGMGGSALEASGVAAPEDDKSTVTETTPQDSSDSPNTLSPAEALRARLARAGKKEDQPEANTQGDEQQPEMNSEKLRELIDNCLRAAQSAREGLEKAMQSIHMAGNMSLDGFQVGLSFADGNLNQVGNAVQVLESATSQKEVTLLGNSVNEVRLRIRSLDANVRSGENVDRGYLSRLLERVDEMIRFVAELRERQDQDRHKQAKKSDNSSPD